MISDLYNGDILSLSSTLKNTRLSAPDGTARKVSKLCGSELEIDLTVKAARVTACALRVQACALGQASAAILQDGIIGASRADIISARDALQAMLKSNGVAPEGRFAKLALLSAVATYSARHMSTMLAFDAAVAAIDNALDK